MADRLSRHDAMPALGHYVLGEPLARNPASTVYRVHDTRLDRQVALKLLTATDPAARARFLARAHLAAALWHPHLIPIYEIGLAGDQPYTVMPLVLGQPLDQLLAPGEAVTLPLALGLLGACCSALVYLHEHGLVHGAVCPATVLVSTGEHTVLTSLRGGARSDTVSAGYVAPECVDGAPPDQAADVYGLGLLGYRVLTGRLPDDVRPPALRRTLSDLGHGLPASLVDALSAALAAEPRQRPTAAAFAAALTTPAVAVPPAVAPLPVLCPALGHASDRATAALFATPEHVCYAGKTPFPPSLDHQTSYCLGGPFVRCPFWQSAAVSAAVPQAVARPSTRRGRRLLLLGGALLAAGGLWITVARPARSRPDGTANGAAGSGATVVMPGSTATPAAPVPAAVRTPAVSLPFEAVAPIPAADIATPLVAPERAVPGTPVPATTVPTPALTWVSYRVQSGESLSVLALRYGVSLATLAAANGLTVTSPLTLGQLLQVPVAPDVAP